MNSPLNLLKIFILFLFCLTQSFSQWVQTGGPEGGYANEILQIEDKLILNTNFDIYSSLDNGSSWILSSTGLPDVKQIHTLLENNGILYCSIYQNGIYKSLDRGLTWLSSNTGIENDTFYSMLAFDDKIFAGLANGGIMFSPDNGATWVDKSLGVQEIQFAGLSKMNDKIYAAGSSNAIPQEYPVLYVSDNDGEIWTPIEVPYLDANGLTTVFVDDTNLYVADVGHVYLSKDEGQTWQQTTLSTYATIKSMSKYEDSIYATTSNGRYFVTNDEGSIWTKIQNVETSQFINDLYITDSKIFMSTSTGIYESYDNGQSWNLNNTGIKSLWVRALAANSEYIFAGTSGQGVFRSNNNGETWEIVNNGLGDDNLFINDLHSVDEIVYVNTGRGVFSTNDNGETWEAKYIPNNNYFSEHLFYNEGLFILVEGPRGILISTDMTDTWVSTNTEGLPDNTGLKTVTVHDDIIMVGTNDGQEFSSDDFGDTWKNVSIPVGYHTVLNLKSYNDTIYAATSQGLFITNDLGINWSRYVAYDTEFTHDIIIENDTVYVGTNNGVLVSDAETDSWHSFNDGLTNLKVTSLLIHNDQFFIGTEFSSIFKINKDQVSLSLLDYDNDGIINKNDLCPDTVQGIDVNEHGCDLVPFKSIRVLATSPSCPNVDNGSVEVISSMLGYDYTIRLIGDNINQELEISNWQENYVFNDLASGTYEVFVTIPSIKHVEEFGISVSEMNAISGKHQNIDTTSKSVTYTVSGSTSYKIGLNGIEKEYFFNSIDTQNIVLNDLKSVNEISISGLNDCQGKIKDTLLMEDEIVLYPSITTGILTLLGQTDNAKIYVFNSNGQFILSENNHSTGSATISLDDYSPGMYFIKVSSNEQTKTFKVIKR